MAGTYGVNLDVDYLEQLAPEEAHWLIRMIRLEAGLSRSQLYPTPQAARDAYNRRRRSRDDAMNFWDGSNPQDGDDTDGE